MTTSAPPPRIPPTITPANRPFWTGGAHGELRLWRDKTTKKWLSPFEDLPSDASNLEEAAASGKGEVFTYTVNRQQYNPDVPPPYVIAIVQLSEQGDVRMPTNIINCAPEDVHVGMKVKAVFEQHGDFFFPLFEPDA